jgi:hypothetical protein
LTANETQTSNAKEILYSNKLADYLKQFEILGLKPLDSWIHSEIALKKPLEPVISWINQVGRVRISFSEPMLLPTFVRYPDFRDPRLMMQNCTNTTANPWFCLNESEARQSDLRVLRAGHMEEDNRPLKY